MVPMQKTDHVGDAHQHHGQILSASLDALTWNGSRTSRLALQRCKSLSLQGLTPVGGLAFMVVANIPHPHGLDSNLYPISYHLWY